MKSPRAAGAVARRVLDVLGGGLLLVVLAPVLALAMILVYWDSGRPVFFGHQRLGRGGQPFPCWKLRTMAPDAEERLLRDPHLRAQHRANGYKLSPDGDPRVTRVGRWLRRWYVDEVPQLWNVLAGQMSLVGPRPVVAEELAEFAPHGAELLRIKPGILGAWTCRGRRRPPYPERVAVELDYVRRQSLARDAAILLRSIPVVLRGQAPE